MDRAPRFDLPDRTSSKTASPDRNRSLSPGKRLRTWETDLEHTITAIKQSQKKLKLRQSYDAKYWTTRTEIADSALNQTQLQRKISAAQLSISPDAFADTEDGQRLAVAEEACRLESKLCRKQMVKMSNTFTEFAIRQSYVTHFAGHAAGWALSNSQGERNSSEQSNFRVNLENKMGSRHIDKLKEVYWCLITTMYWVRSTMTAGHLFPFRAGQKSMNAIFGRIRDEKNNPELFQARNGILWYIGAEERFTKAQLTIVPDVSDEPSKEELRRWQEAKVKDYKIKVLEPDARAMKMKIGHTDTTWTQVNNRKLKLLIRTIGVLIASFELVLASSRPSAATGRRLH